jgi:hypothetical protein
LKGRMPRATPRRRPKTGSARAQMAAALALGLLFPSIAADGVTRFQKSAYTTIDLRHCETLRTHPDGNSYRCEGLPGLPVYFAEGDGRTFVGAGTAPEASRAASQTLKAFNTPFAGQSERATVEWRFVIRDKRQVPYAMIVRYFTHDDRAAGEVLVVSRVAGAEACHMAYIDAKANRDAIVLARRIADQRATTFDCKGNATVEGETGASPM